jgi:hypothetical protein
MFLFACSTLHHGICSTEEVSPSFPSPAPPRPAPPRPAPPPASISFFDGSGG